jgi:hypothetical protein
MRTSNGQEKGLDKKFFILYIFNAKLGAKEVPHG